MNFHAFPHTSPLLLSCAYCTRWYPTGLGSARVYFLNRQVKLWRLRQDTQVVQNPCSRALVGANHAVIGPQLYSQYP